MKNQRLNLIVAFACAAIFASAFYGRPAFAAPDWSKANYNNRVSCRANQDSAQPTTATWVVVPDGEGHYLAGVLCINFDPRTSIDGCDCTFTLKTDSRYKLDDEAWRKRSSYEVDRRYGFVSEKLHWVDRTCREQEMEDNFTDGSRCHHDSCESEEFEDLVTGTLIGPIVGQATQTLITDQNLGQLFCEGDDCEDLEAGTPGTGNCITGGQLGVDHEEDFGFTYP